MAMRATESITSVTRSSMSVNHLCFITIYIFLYKSVASEKRVDIIRLVSFQDLFSDRVVICGDDSSMH